jgi:hypothetical protein
MANNIPQNAQNLRRIWDKKKSEMQFTQVTAAKTLEWTQGAISHYLTGETPLGLSAILKFANFLGVDPTEIDRDFINHLPDVATHQIEYASCDMSKKIDETITTRFMPNSFWVKLVDTQIYWQKNSEGAHWRGSNGTFALVYETRKPERKYSLVRLKGQKDAHIYHVKALPPSKTISKQYNILRVVHEAPVI